MGNEEIISKLMLGKNDLKEIEIEGETFTIRPLTAGELAKLKSIEQGNVKFNTEIMVNGESQPVNSAQIDTGIFVENQNKAKFQAVAWSLSVNGLIVTKEQVEKFRKEIPDLIFKEVIRVSNLTEKDLGSVKSFQ